MMVLILGIAGFYRKTSPWSLVYPIATADFSYDYWKRRLK